ncbi:hypothetical protein [Phormidium sp. CCY1219]|uniref:hypothetical protein n=1 Tax=Phormidium sp. CCY1219 TaxID=2886104 RepID=UPI002D1ECBFB|nr:hypothetical protein [Phormidium sp. CCY1219]MEB3828136.1 hypothetical protein [Phormidium sp. CCY1219]
MSRKKSKSKPTPGERCLAVITVFGFDPGTDPEQIPLDPDFHSHRVALFEFSADEEGIVPGWLAVEEITISYEKKRKSVNKQAQNLAKKWKLPLRKWPELEPEYLGELEGMTSYYDYEEERFLELDYSEDEEDFDEDLSIIEAEDLSPPYRPSRKECQLLGYVAVDRGILVMTDPSYLPFWNNNLPDPSNKAQDFSFSGAQNAAKQTEQMGGQLYAPFQSPEAVREAIAEGRTPLFEAGVAVSTGIGDGVYPVYAEYQNLGHPFGKRVVRVTVDFSHHFLLQDDFNAAEMMEEW